MKKAISFAIALTIFAANNSDAQMAKTTNDAKKVAANSSDIIGAYNWVWQQALKVLNILVPPVTNKQNADKAKK